MMMRQFRSICILSDDYPSSGRPVYIFVEQLVHAILEIGVDVYVIAPQSLTRSFFRKVPLLPKNKKMISPNGCEYWVYRPYSLTFSNNKGFLYRISKSFNQKTIDICVDKIKPEILYGHFWHNANSLKNYAKRNDIPLFVACGEGDDAMENLATSMSLEEKKLLANTVSGVISVSTENKRRSISLGLAHEEDVIVLPNAVDTTIFHPMEKNIELRHSLGVKDDDFLIVFVGYFIPRKGCRILADAINQINNPKLKVMFVGESLTGYDYDPDCKGIVYKGKVPHEELPSIYASADAFVLPTLKEGCSNAIIEALAMAVPVISSEGPFNDDILSESNSIRVNPDSVEEIATAILKMKNDHFFYNCLKTNMRQQANNYSIKNRAEKIISFIGNRSQEKKM